MSSVSAQGLRYRVEIDAPRDLARTLRQGLSLVRWQSDAQMTPEQLRRIAKESEREAREVAATEGYFSAGVDRKSTRLNSSHLVSSYAVFCLKKKKLITHNGRDKIV